MHGEIGVESTVGAGSTFWFTVEMAKQAVTAELTSRPKKSESGRREPNPHPDQGGTPRRAGLVLIVEDNDVNRFIATAQVQKQGYVVDSVTNGIEALEACLRTTYDIILMDCQMPELDGYETTRQLREREGPRPYIIAMTANAMQGDRELCLAAGMDNYISKPVRIAELKAALDEAKSEGGKLVVAAVS
jgi:CheY-like chemotaxis protein